MQHNTVTGLTASITKKQVSPLFFLLLY